MVYGIYGIYHIVYGSGNYRFINHKNPLYNPPCGTSSFELLDRGCCVRWGVLVPGFWGNMLPSCYVILRGCFSVMRLNAEV